MTDWYFDRYGQAAFLLLEGDRFVSRNGRNLGWLHREKEVFTLTGRAIGYLEKGVVRDPSGGIVGFTRSASSTLSSIPGMSGAPSAPSANGRPPKPGFAGSVNKPPSAGWSGKSVRDFFGTDI